MTYHPLFPMLNLITTLSLLWQRSTGNEWTIWLYRRIRASYGLQHSMWSCRWSVVIMVTLVSMLTWVPAG